ncbi:MAG: NPCBM/NEW2 domain-containing protein [Bacteroidales bacterium]
MKIINKLSVLLLLVFMSALPAMSQDVEIMDFLTLGGSSQSIMKVRVNLGGKTIKSVQAGDISLDNGAFRVTGDSFTFLDEEYLSIPFVLADDLPIRVAYRVIVTFTDDSKLISPSVRGDKAESIIWLSDMEWNQATTGWKTPEKDKGVGGPLILINDKQYYKGISNHTFSSATTPAVFEYDIPVEASAFYTLIGAQDTEYNGDIDVAILMDDVTMSRDTLFAKTNPALDNRKVIQERIFFLQGEKNLKLEGYNFDRNNAGDWCNYAMAHFVVPFRSIPQKEQSIEFSLSSSNTKQEYYVLNARATSGLLVSYHITEGTEFGYIRQDTLFVHHGVKGEITVEANQHGNGEYIIATPVSQSIYVDREVKFQAHGVESHLNKSNLFFSFDPANKQVSDLKIYRYNNVELMQITDSLILIRNGQLLVSPKGQTFNIEVPDYDSIQVYKAKVIYHDGSVITSDLFDNKGDNMVFMSDLSYEVRGGYGHGYRVDVSYDNTVLEILDKTYTKGFGIFTTGWAKVRDLHRFNRFVTDYGYHKGFSGDAIASLKVNDTEVQNSGVFRNNVRLTFDQNLSEADVLEVYLNANGSNYNEIIDLGAARFYETPKNIREQVITWKPFEDIKVNEPTVFDLTASCSSLNQIYYRIVKGEEYAELIDDGTKLSIFQIPAEAEIIVEAFQPGDLDYAAAIPVQCSFRMTRAIVVQAHESRVLDGGTDIEELIVYGNTSQSGQVSVNRGIVKIRRMVYKFRMKPGKSHILTFPVTADLDKISNFREQGYLFNNDSENGWKLQVYDGEDRALNGQRIQNWKDVNSSVVEAFKGYIIIAPKRSSDESIEVSFVFENVSLDHNSQFNQMNLTLDFSGRMPGKDYRAYVKPENVKGNVLTVSIDYQPPIEYQPMNYREEVEKARLITFNQGRQFRISLPVTHIAAQVYVLNKKGSKVLKAYEYYAPAAIDVSELKKGRYPVIVKFGDQVSPKELLVE